MFHEGFPDQARSVRPTAEYGCPSYAGQLCDSLDFEFDSFLFDQFDHRVRYCLADTFRAAARTDLLAAALFVQPFNLHNAAVAPNPPVW